MSVRSALKLWAAAAAGYDAAQVVSARYGGPAPSGDHIAIGRPISRMRAPAFLVSVMTDVNGVRTEIYEQPLVYVVPVEVFAADGWELLDDMTLETQYYSTRKILSDAGLALSTYSAVRDLTDAGDTGPAYRFQRDFEFLGSRQVTKTDYSLDVFSFQGEIVSDTTGTSTESYSVDFTEE